MKRSILSKQTIDNVMDDFAPENVFTYDKDKHDNICRYGAVELGYMSYDQKERILEYHDIINGIEHVSTISEDVDYKMDNKFSGLLTAKIQNLINHMEEENENE